MFTNLISDQSDSFYASYFTQTDDGQTGSFQINALTGAGIYLGQESVSAVSKYQVFKTFTYPFAQINIYPISIIAPHMLSINFKWELRRDLIRNRNRLQ